MGELQEKGKLMYDTIEEANQKLQNSTVFFDGRPVQVMAAGGVRGDVTLSFYNLPYPKFGPSQDSLKTERINDIRWDFKSLGERLGFVNIEKSPWDNVTEAVFCTRIPSRVARQGLDSRTTRVNQVLVPTERVHPWGWDHLLYHDGLVKTVQGKFPSVKEAVDRLVRDSGRVKSIAISKKFALIYDRVNPPNLVYRNEKIGYVEGDSETFKLAPHKSYLGEEITDMEGLKIA